MDIREYPEVIDALNAIIANRGAAEVKLEGKDSLRLVVVEVARKVKKQAPVK